MKTGCKPGERANEREKKRERDRESREGCTGEEIEGGWNGGKRLF